MSSIPTNKAELQLAIEQSFDKLLLDYQRVPADMSRILGVEGNQKGSVISVSDTLAYLIGWGRLVLKWHELKAQGKSVDFPETGFKWNRLGELASHFQQEYQVWQYDDLLKEFACVISDILCLIHQTDSESLYQSGWYKDWSQGRMIQFNTSSPMKNIRTKVRRFIKQNSLK